MQKQKEEMAGLVQQAVNLPVILASSSPRRSELLLLIFKEFKIIAPTSESDGLFNTPADEAAAKAHEKGLDVFQNNKDSLVISADTIVVNDGIVFGKPKNLAEAKAMLEAYSGKTHEVITAVSLFSPKVEHSFLVGTEVSFFPLSSAEIEDYIESEKPFDKAGGYGIQGASAKFIKSIKGDYYSVMGLPVSALYQALKNLNLIKKR